MTDTLHTRIAAAIREVDDMRVCKLSDADIKFITDAVIAELGLRIQVAGPDGIAYGKHRYVTDWTADE